MRALRHVFGDAALFEALKLQAKGELAVPQVKIVVREPGGTTPDFSVLFNLPTVPGVGDYISIHRSDQATPHTEDVVVRHVWWRLEHFETRAIVSEETEQAGNVREIVVECDPAIGPWSTDRWREALEAARAPVEKFDLERLSVREDFLAGSRKRGTSREH